MRARDGWQEAVREPLAFAADYYERTFGVRFQVVEVVEWDSDDTGPGPGDLVEVPIRLAEVLPSGATSRSWNASQ
jgi:hypothetical protein